MRIGEKHINIENPAAADSTVAAATADNMAAAAAALSQLDDEIVHGMAIGAVFTDYVSSIRQLAFSLEGFRSALIHRGVCSNSAPGRENKLPRFPPQGGSPRHLQRGRLHTTLQHHHRDVSTLPCLIYPNFF